MPSDEAAAQGSSLPEVICCDFNAGQERVPLPSSGEANLILQSCPDWLNNLCTMAPEKLIPSVCLFCVQHYYCAYCFNHAISVSAKRSRSMRQIQDKEACSPALDFTETSYNMADPHSLDAALGLVGCASRLWADCPQVRHAENKHSNLRESNVLRSEVPTEKVGRPMSNRFASLCPSPAVTAGGAHLMLWCVCAFCRHAQIAVEHRP